MSKSTTADLKTLLVTFEHQPRAVRSSLGTEFLRIALDRDAEPVSRVEAALTVSNKAGMLGIVGSKRAAQAISKAANKELQVLSFLEQQGARADLQFNIFRLLVIALAAVGRSAGRDLLNELLRQTSSPQAMGWLKQFLNALGKV